MLSRCYRPLSPRKPQGLPYLRTNRVGRLSYVRRIPPKRQKYAGNRTVIRCSLGVSSTNQADPLVISAWSRVHRETETLLEQAKIDQAEERLAERPQVPPTPRHQAGSSGTVAPDARDVG